MSEYYRDKSVLITGASAGIGYEFAKQLHAKGANLTLVARRKDRLNKIAEELNFIRAQSVKIIACDLTKADTDSSSEITGLDYLSEYLKKTEIDIFINNAGIGSFGRFELIPLQHEMQIIKLNIIASTQLLQSCVGMMKGRQSGAIINLSSVAGFQPLPFMSTYSASKAFNLFQSLALRAEVKEFGIRVLVVCPGPTETEFFGVARMPGTATGGKRDKVEDVVSESLRALENDRACVVTGWRAKLMVFGSTIAPKRVSTWLMKKALVSSLPG